MQGNTKLYIDKNTPNVEKIRPNVDEKWEKKNANHRKATNQPTPRRGKQRDHQSTQGASQREKKAAGRTLAYN